MKNLPRGFVLVDHTIKFNDRLLAGFLLRTTSGTNVGTIVTARSGYDCRDSVWHWCTVSLNGLQHSGECPTKLAAVTSCTDHYEAATGGAQRSFPMLSKDAGILASWRAQSGRTGPRESKPRSAPARVTTSPVEVVAPVDAPVRQVVWGTATPGADVTAAMASAFSKLKGAK